MPCIGLALCHMLLCGYGEESCQCRKLHVLENLNGEFENFSLKYL